MGARGPKKDLALRRLKGDPKALGPKRPKAQPSFSAYPERPKPVPFDESRKRYLTEVIMKVPGFNPYREAGDCWFDAEAAHNVLEFFPQRLRHVKGKQARYPFKLEQWQEAWIANLFGWKRADGTRRFREAFVYVPKKNGKTATGAGLVDYILAEDHEQGAEVYSAACSRDQASLIFSHAAGMVRQDEYLSGILGVLGMRGGSQLKTIYNEEEMSAYKALAADANTADGTSPHFAIIDELHRHPDGELADVLQKSTAARKQPLVVYTTTADYDRPESPCNRKLAYARGVLDGSISDPSFLPVIYEAKLSDDWTSPEVWKKANPNFGITVGADFFERECKKAIEDISTQNDFKRLHLNIVTEAATAWIASDKWAACAGEGANDPVEWRADTLARLAKAECRGGLDLGSTSDLTAFVLLFPEGDLLTIVPWFWMPRDGLRKKDPHHARLYEEWIQQGFVTATEGNICDYKQVRADINQIASAYGMRDCAVDRLFQGAELCSNLMSDGLTLTAFGQGFVSMAAPTKLFGEKVLAKKIRHGNNPVLKWMASNVQVLKDPVGNMKPVKPKDGQRKIDGIVASVMALGRLYAEPAPPASVYARRGVVAV